MAGKGKKRTAAGVYSDLKAISNETGVDFGVDKMSLSGFTRKYFSNPKSIATLHDNLSAISDETGIDFGQGTKDEWLGSFGYKGNGKGGWTSAGGPKTKQQQQLAQAPNVYQRANRISGKADATTAKVQQAPQVQQDTQPWQQPWELDMSEKAVMPFQREDKRRAEAPISPQTGKAVPKKDPVKEEIKDIDRAAKGDKEAAKRVGVTAAQERMRDEMDYYNATGAPLRSEINMPITAPTVARDENGEMILGEDGKPLVGYTTDVDRVAQYQQQERAVERRKIIEPLVDDIINKTRQDAHGQISLDDITDPGMAQYKLRMENEATSPEALRKALDSFFGGDRSREGGSAFEQYLVDHQADIERGAARVGMSVDDFVMDELIPKMSEDIERRLGQNLSEEYSIKGRSDYFLNRMLSSGVGALVRMGSGITPQQSQLMQEELQKTKEGKGAHFNARWYDKAIGEVAQFAPDAPLMMLGGAAGGAATKAVGAGLKALGAESLGALVASGSPFLAANVGKAVKYGGLLGNRIIGGAVNMGTFMGMNGALQAMASTDSTEDGYWSSVGLAGLEGFEEGAKMGTALGVLGMAGNKAMSLSSTAKGRAAIAASAFLAENQIFAASDYLADPEKFNWVDSSLDAFYMMMAGRASGMMTHGTEGMKHSFANILYGEPKGMPRLTDDEKSIIQKAFGGMDFVKIAGDVNNIGKILADKANIPLNVRQKIAGATMGVFEPNRPHTYMTNIRGNEIQERAKDGELLAVHKFADKDERDRIMQEIADRKSNDEMISYYNLLNLKNQPGLTDVLDNFSRDYETNPEAVREVMAKKPVERSFEEQEMMDDLSSRLHDAAFPEGELHPVQSEVDGGNLAGSEPVVDPNVSQQISQEVDKAFDEYSRFLQEHAEVRDGIDSLGEARPDEVLLYIANNFSGSERDEGMRVVSNYFNAMAKKNGYIRKVGDNINNYVDEEVDSSGFKGMLDGEPDVKNIITVTDGEINPETGQPRRLTLLNGEVGTKEDAASGSRMIDPEKSGGQIICRDENGEFVILKPDAKISFVEQVPKEDFANGLRQELGVRNTQTVVETGLEKVPEPAEGPQSHLQEGDLELWPQVKEWLDANPDATVGQIQREFRIGFNKATRMHDEYNRLKQATAKSTTEGQQGGQPAVEAGREQTGADEAAGETPAEVKTGKAPFIGSTSIDDVAWGSTKRKNRGTLNAKEKDGVITFDIDGHKQSIKIDGKDWVPSDEIIVDGQVRTVGLTKEELEDYDISENSEFTAQRIFKSNRDGKWYAEGYFLNGKSKMDGQTEAIVELSPEFDLNNALKSHRERTNKLYDDYYEKKGENSSLDRIPKDESRAVEVPTDKDGVKRYEQSGIDVDAAIEDLQKDQIDPTQMADAMISEAEETIKKIGKKKNPKPADIVKDTKARLDAQQVIDYWTKLKNRVAQQHADELARKAAEEEAQRRAAAEAAALQARQKQEVELSADERFKANRERFSASREEGDEDSIVLANGETIEGRYVLVDADAVTPSHNPRGNFAKSEGFPVDENGKTINDRDYENDKTAQVLVQKRSQSYDQRAVNTPVVVSEDGIVLSGNDRTMSGQLAADNKTDGAYVDYITKHAKKWGFTPEQVAGKKNPRIVFVPNEKMEYNAETFAKFNQDEKKSQSKLETSVKMGKVLATKPETLGRIGSIIGQVENLSDLYSDVERTKDVLLAMKEGGLITDEGIARLTDENGLLSAQGKDEFETMLAGVVVDEDALRILNNPANSLGDLRRSIAYAVVPLVKNQTLGEYSIVKDVSEAVRLYDSARKKGLINKDGDITNYFINKDAFEGAPMDTHSLTQLMLANQMSKGGYHLKRIIEAYNSEGQNAAAGQVDMWSGGIRSKEEILTDILKQQGYDAEAIKERVERLRKTEPPVESDTEGGERRADRTDDSKGEGRTEPEGGVEPQDNEIWEDANGREHFISVVDLPNGKRGVTATPIMNGKLVESERRNITQEEYLATRKEVPDLYVNGKRLKPSEIPTGEFTPSEYDKAAKLGGKDYKSYQDEARNKINSLNSLEEIEAFRKDFVDKIANESAKNIIRDNLLAAEERISGKKLYKRDDMGFYEKDKEGKPIRLDEAEAKPQPTEKEPSGKAEGTDEYLKPRNEKEKEIVKGVLEQLQQEIGEAVKERDKAASALEKARAEESDKATDLFSDDNAFKEEGQLFDSSDMPTDRSQEGVNKRTSAERERLNEAQAKLDKLQSEAERDSRVRGALDNERKQTKIPSGEAEGTEADKPLTSLAEVKKFMDEIGYKGSLSKVITDKNGKKAIRYQASGKVTPVIVLGETTKRDIYRQFRNYRNVMDVRIPSGIDAELSREDASLKEIKDALYASDRDEIKDILTEAGIPFADVIDSERGSRIVFTDKKNGNGNYTDWVDVSDPEQAREDIDYIKSKAERYKADPMETIEQAADEFKKEQDKEIGITHDETPEQKADRENAEKFADTPITADEIDGANISDVEKTLAKAYLNGNQGFLQKAAYLKAYDNVRNRRQDGTGDSLDAESGTQLDSGENQREPGSGRVGESAVPMDEAKGGVADEGQTRLADGKGQPDTPVGERGDRSVSGAEPSVDGLPSGGERREGSRESGGTRRDVRGAESDKGGGKNTPKPAAGSDAAIAASKQRLAELRKRFWKAGRNGMVNVSLVGMNSEQIEVLMDITTEAANLGYQYLAKGIREFKEWNKQMLDDFHDWLQEDMKWSDAEIDEYLNEVWNCEYNINGVTRSIREWASFLGEKELRKQVKSTLGDKFEAQKAAEGIEVKTGDIDNIRETLPFLLPEQQDDVLKAETQFFDESHQDREHGNGKGMMFTNGTGTGKTYTGLGIVKRFVKQGKGRVLILTPSQEKVTDWANDGLNLGLNVEKLDDIAKAKGTTATKSKGTGVVVTTYANARQNLALLEDCFDLIVYDESHKITEGKEAAEGEMYKFHQMLTNKDVEKSIDRQTYWLPEWIEYRNLVKEREENRKRLDILDNYSSDETVKVDGNEINVGELRSRLNARMLEIENRFGELQPIMQEIRESKRGQAEIDSKRTKTVFLSATPFNTRENMKYAEGYLFSYPEEDPSTVGSYNHRSPEDAFLERYFPAGYRWRYGRLESHVSNAEALGRQEIDFSDYLQNQLGTLSGRMISSDYDYSRDFPIMTLDHAGRFNQAMSEVYRNKRYNAMSEAFRKSFDYNYSTALFEAMKTSLVIDRIKEHLKRGQKVVVFHRRRTSGDLEPPFEKALNVARVMAEVEGQNGNQKGKQEILNAVKAFSEDFADMLEWEKGLDYTLPRDQIAKVFGEDKIGFFSGAENKKTKHGSVEDFMKDNGGKDIIIIQEASGKEGISLHDQTGEHQRVEINLALPQSPIAFIQIEGRIYRIGQKSNAIFEYPLLGLDLETDLFAQRFNSALGTTENLALGSKARNLRKSIANSILMNTGMVDYDRQGLGGKDMDGQVSSRTKDGFDDAINDYYGNQKMQRGRANREGYDYFPTPEPVGFKMVEWGQLMEGESALEPSAGHGAIARYVPETNSLTAIEPSADLFSKLQLRAGGPGRRFEEKTFEDYPLANKHDVIVMNPPYGTQGKMAMEHVEKAFKHLNEGGRLIAIIPDGPAMEKRFDAWLNSTGADRPNGSNVLVGEVKLPDVAFGRAGTNVRTRIVVIDKVSRPQMREGMPERVSVDLSGAATVEDMFEELRHVNMPERTIDQAAIAQKQALKTRKSLEDNKFVRDVVIDEYGVRVGNRSSYGSVPGVRISFEQLDNPAHRRSLLQQVEGLIKARDNAENLDYGKWKNKTYGSGKNAVPAVEAIRDYCDTAIKTIANVLKTTPDGLEKEIKFMKEEEERQRQEREAERQRAIEQREREHEEKVKSVIETALKENGNNEKMTPQEIAENIRLAHGQSWSDARTASAKLRAAGIDWETGHQIVDKMKTLESSYNEQMPLSLETMKRLMVIADTAISAGSRMSAKRALEMSGIHSDTGEAKEGFDYSSHDEYYEKDLRGFLGQASPFSRLKTRIQEQEERKPAPAAPQPAKKESFEYKLDQNTKTGADMHLVVMNERVDDATYKDLQRKAKALNDGYYNRFKKAWHFKTEEDARKFMEQAGALKGTRFREEPAKKTPKTAFRELMADEDGRFDFEKPISSKKLREKGIAKDLRDIKANKWNLPERVRDVVAEKLEQYMSNKDGEIQDIDYSPYFGEKGETTAKSVLEHIGENSTDKGVRELASYLLKNLGDNSNVPVRFSESRVGARGSYYTHDHSVVIRRGAARGADEVSARNNLEQTIIHEIAHAVTVRAIENSPEVRKEFLQIYKDYVELSEQYGINTGYAAKNPKEFVAEFLGRKAFREALMELRDGKKSFGQRVLDFIKEKIFHISPKDTFFDKADDAIKKVLDMANKGDYPYSDEVAEDNGREEKRPIFESNAHRAVESIKQEKGTPEQWLKMIEKAGGLKAGEDKWMGLSEWLKGQDKKSLTKQDVLDFIRENQVKVEETNYSEEISDKVKARIEEIQNEFNEVKKEIASELEGNEDVSKQLRDYSDYLYDKYGAAFSLKYTKKEGERFSELVQKDVNYKKAVRENIDVARTAYRRLKQKYGEGFSDAFELRGRTPVIAPVYGRVEKFLGEGIINDVRRVYTTKGLENKKEIALVVPTVESWNRGDEIHFGDAGNGRAVAWVRFGETEGVPNGVDADRYHDYSRKMKEAISRRDEMVEQLKRYKGGMLTETQKRLEEEEAYIQQLRERYKDVADVKPSRVLVIDEIQSKRHQEGREKGYAQKEAIKLTPENVGARRLGEDMWIVGEREDGAITMTESVSASTKEEAKQKYIEKYKVKRKIKGIPDAPFDKNWHELAMKRMLRYAAENGYDKVAWTKGEQQAERYNLEKVVDKIEATDSYNDGVKHVTLRLKGDWHIEDFGVDKKTGEVLGGQYKGRKLQDVIGKEAAEKILSDDDVTLEGDGLKFGGEGMKGFYDQMLPRFMDKYGKKWGVKTGEVELPNVEEAGRKMWSVDVTPEMKESVMQGQTMFKEGTDVSGLPEHAQKIVHSIEKTAKKLNTPVKIARSIDEVTNKDALKALREGRIITGWFEDGTGEIVLYLPNIADKYSAMKTVAHEVVGHNGLRALLGEEGYRSYMRTLWLDMKDESLSKYIKENYSRHGDIYTTIDEYLAEAAEKGYGKLPMWQKVRDVMTDALRKAGFEMTPSISDVKYMVWLSKHRLESGNPINAIERNALLHRLNMEKNEARVRNGEFSFDDETPAVTRGYFPGDKTLFRSTPSAKTAKWLYEKALSRWGYSWKESHVDKMQAAVELMRAISGVKKIEDIPSVENFVLAENQMSSKEEQIDYLFNRDYMEPLTKAVAAVLPEFGGNTERALRNLQVYMVKKSGLERNRCLYVRDKIREYRKDADMDQNAVDQLEDDWNQLLDDIRDDIRKGTINLREYLKNMDAFIRQNIDANYKADDHDYSGLTAMTGSKKGYDDSMVIDDVMDDESMVGEEKIKTLWEKTKAVSQYGLDAEYEGGLDSKEKHDKVSKMFEWYVPMRGYDETRAEEVYDYLEENKGSEFVGPVLMNAKGRESLSNVDIFAQLGAMSCNAVHRALKNQMKQSFARFVRNHYDKDGKDRLVTELKYLWGEKRYDPDTGASYWEEVFPDIPENATADDVAKIVEDFEKDMKAKEAAGSAKRMRQNSSIPFRMSPKNKPQHIVEVYINGEKKTFIVNGNPRAAQAINGELNPETNHRVINRITRTMAQLNTSYNPDFVVGNTERDYIFSSAAILAKESPKYFAHWQKNYFGRGIARGVAGVPMMHTNLFKRYRQGNLDMSNETDRYFKEFMENGGETGWVEQKNLEKWRKEIKQGVKTQGTAEKAGRFIINAIPEAIEAMNERAENAARFATYMTSRQMGRSITRSVSDAKEVSVNFNRKGAGLKAKDFAKNGSALRKMNAIAAARTAQYGQDYLMFYNAGVQGLNNAAKILRDHPIKASTIFAGFALGAFLMSNLNQALIDDEDPKERGGIQNPYAELPEWIRRNRLCLYAGKGEFITVDLPIELRALYGIGDIAAAYTTHPELRSQKPVWQDVMTQITQILPVDFMGEHPGEPWMSFVPSFAMPFAEVAMNQNWYGRKIEKDQYVDENDPRWTRAYRNANRAYIDASKGLNAGTNRYSEEDLKKMGIKKEDVGNVDAQIKGAADGKVTDPAIVEHIVNGYFGGAGQTAGRLAAIAKGALQGENIGDLAKSPQMPIVRRLHYSPTEQNKMARTRNKWWHYKDEMDNVMNDMKVFQEHGVTDPLAKMKQLSLEDSVRATRAIMMYDAQKQYKALKKLYDNMKDGADKDTCEARMDQLMENTVIGLDSIR